MPKVGAGHRPLELPIGWGMYARPRALLPG